MSDYYNLQMPENFLDKVEFVKNLSKTIGITICAKGRRDIITNRERIKINYGDDAIMGATNCSEI